MEGQFLDPLRPGDPAWTPSPSRVSGAGGYHGNLNGGREELGRAFLRWWVSELWKSRLGYTERGGFWEGRK